MTSDYNLHSRLSRKEEIRSYRRIAILGLGTIALIFSLFLVGIPVLINVSSFLSSLHSTNEPITTQDTTPPFPPRLYALQEATNSAKINISGTAESSSTIELFADDVSATKTVVDKNGSFEFMDITLNTGKNTFYTKAMDQAGNKSQQSNSISITFTKNSPKIDLTEPSEGANISNDDKTVKVSGKTESVKSLTINGRVVILDNNGGFSYTLPLTDGDNTIKVIGTDIAGNQTTVERKVTFTSPQ